MNDCKISYNSIDNIVTYGPLQLDCAEVKRYLNFVASILISDEECCIEQCVHVIFVLNE